MTSPFADPMRVFYGEVEASGDPYGFEFDADFGAGENQYESLAGLLANGEVVSSTRTSNRELVFSVLVDTDTLSQAAEGELPLLAEADRSMNTITVHPGNYGDPFVFETFKAQVTFERTEALEIAGKRRIVFTVPARPFTRSPEPTFTEVLAAPPPVAPTTLAIAPASGSWAASGAGVVVPAPPDVTGSWASASSHLGHHLVWATGSPVSTASMPYLGVAWRAGSVNGFSWSQHAITVNEVRYEPSQFVSDTALPGGWRMTWIKPTAAQVRSVGVRGRLTKTANVSVGSNAAWITVHSVVMSSVVGSLATSGHQLARTVDVGGSAPTEASIHLWHNSSDLGDVLIHTSSTPNGMFSLDPFCASAKTAASGTVSGSTKSLSSPVSYDIPADVFDPDKASGYLLMGRLARTGAGAVTASVQSRAGDAIAETSVAVGSAVSQSTVPPSSGSPVIVTLGAFNMPPVRVGPGGFVRVTVSLASPEGTPTLDDLWLVDVETGSLTQVAASDSQRHVYIDAPTVGSVLPRVRSARNSLGAFERDVPAVMARHSFPPGALYIYTVATGAQSSAVQLSYYPRWHTHALASAAAPAIGFIGGDG